MISYSRLILIFLFTSRVHASTVVWIHDIVNHRLASVARRHLLRDQLLRLNNDFQPIVCQHTPWWLKRLLPLVAGWMQWTRLRHEHARGTRNRIQKHLDQVSFRFWLQSDQKLDQIVFIYFFQFVPLVVCFLIGCRQLDIVAKEASLTFLLLCRLLHW